MVDSSSQSHRKVLYVTTEFQLPDPYFSSPISIQKRLNLAPDHGPVIESARLPCPRKRQEILYHSLHAPQERCSCQDALHTNIARLQIKIAPLHPTMQLTSIDRAIFLAFLGLGHARPSVLESQESYSAKDTAQAVIADSTPALDAGSFSITLSENSESRSVLTVFDSGDHISDVQYDSTL